MDDSCSQPEPEEEIESPFKRVCYENKLVSIIIPAKDVGSKNGYLEACLQSCLEQTYRPIQISITNDGSKDDTLTIISNFQSKTADLDDVEIICTSLEKCGGAGNARNLAIAAASGAYLCFIDSDDMMLPKRIHLQLEVLQKFPNAIIGGGFRRIPEDATHHYTQWANALTDEQLMLQQYRECTVIMPTWMMTLTQFNKVGGFPSERFRDDGVILPEDLTFFHKHIDCGGIIKRVSEEVVIYRHSGGSVSSKIPRRVLLKIRLAALERRLLDKVDRFWIWGAGRDARNFYNDLKPENRKKVVALGDVDVKKIGTTYVNHVTKDSVKVVHFSELKSPFICCVAMGRTGGALEANVKSLNMVEGEDYWHFN
eukprot:TRINITY_DN3803_c0_g2_i1.p1 TRINITY_DN3803_c0_g2~~TRINITY_DN3803_c0_g2_i1.p1  ORF type:complete len:369 (-),score=92.14 TRINITY_DN3803_c0_g2_i1:210-1316(-)